MRDNRKPPDPDPQPFPMSLSDPLPPPARRRWLQQLPYLSLALFLAAIAALVWLTREYDDEAQRATLISDVLWMEQNLRFNLDRNENHLQEIGPELLATSGAEAGATVTIGGQVVTKPQTAIGFVFQSPTLLEWRSVLDNGSGGSSCGFDDMTGV